MILRRLLGLGFASLVLMIPQQLLAKAESSIPMVRVGNLQWDQHEMTIDEVKRFASQTGFVSRAEKNGGGTVYELGFVQKPGWTWKTPYGVKAQDREPAVHLNATEAEQICRFFGKRLPTDEEWVSAAFVEQRANLEQRANPPAPFVGGKRYRFPNGDSPKGSHCLDGECGNYQGLAPKDSLLRGTGHVLTGSTEAGVSMASLTWALMCGSGLLQRRAVSGSRAEPSWWYGAEQQRESNRASKPLDVSVIYIGFRCVKP